MISTDTHFVPVALKDRPEFVWTMTTKGGTVVDPIKYSGTNVLVRVRSSKVDGRRTWWAPMSMLHLTQTPNPRVLTKAAAKAASADRARAIEAIDRTSGSPSSWR